MTSVQRTNTRATWLRIIKANQMTKIGKSRDEIANYLGISTFTVSSYCWSYENLFRYNSEFRELDHKYWMQ